jgi:hypothetical protein
MKLIVISCLKEDKETAMHLMEKCGIAWIYFVDSSDYRAGQNLALMDGWFAIDKEYTDSVILFSLTDAAKASLVIDASDNLNTQRGDECYLLKSFVVPLEKWTTIVE